MKKTSLLSTLLFSVLSLTACVQQPIASSSQNIEQTQLPDQVSQNIEVPSTTSLPTSEDEHQLITIKGKSLQINETKTGLIFPEYEGKIILFQIFGKNCHYCFEEQSIINKLRSQYGSRLEVIAIQADDPMTAEDRSRILNQHKMNYPIIEKEMASNLLLSISEKYGWTGSLPYLQIIKEGVVEYSSKDIPDYIELSEIVESLL